MPYLRFSRDKRGYENTFVVHQDRRRGKGGSRLLYWFRTPPGVKVGRAALDEDAIRMLEELNPGIEFDWTRILKAEPAPQEARPPAPPKRPAGPMRQIGSPRERDRRPAPPRAGTDSAPPLERVADVQELLADPAVTNALPDVAETAPFDVPLTEVPLPDAHDENEERESQTLLPSAAQARLGTEGIVRLRGRYAEVLARIDERITDAARRDELKAQAERLNPDAWVTDAEVQAGLEQYESVFDSLRAVVGRRRRRRRRHGPRQQPGSVGPSTAPDAGDDNGDDAEDL